MNINFNDALAVLFDFQVIFLSSESQVKIKIERKITGNKASFNFFRDIMIFYCFDPDFFIIKFVVAS